MGIAGFLISKAGLPLLLIAGAGFLIVSFRSQLLTGATNLGSTVGQVITTPFTSFFDSIRNAFSNLGDINIQLPGVNVTGGGFEFNLDDSFTTTTTTVNEDPLDFGDDEIQFPPGCTIDDQGRVSCDSPPGVIVPPGKTTFEELTPFGDPERRTFIDLFNLQSLERQSRERTTKGEILSDFPTAVGLFDIVGEKGSDLFGTERIPLSFNQLRAIINQGQEVRLSSQLFEEFGSVKDIFEAFA